MAKTQTKKIAKLKFLLVLPAMAILVMCFAFSSGNSGVNTMISNESSSISNQDVKPENEEKEIFMVVEKMPQFTGGEIALQKYLYTNIQYPELARKEGIQGRVYVTYVVETDGSITDVRILRGIGGGCDEEAIKVVKNMPKWTPGTQRGQVVRVQFNLPIRFVLGGETADEKNKSVAISKGNDDKVKITYKVVEEMPEFVGGETALSDYLNTNIKYPEAAIKAKVSGKVYVTYIVNTDGSISGIKLLRGIGSGCDEEAIRVVTAMPKWNPGKQRGELVQVQYVLPISFQLK